MGSRNSIISSSLPECCVLSVGSLFRLRCCHDIPLSGRYPVPLYSLLLVALSHTLPKQFYLIFFARLSTLTRCYRLLLSAPYLTISLSAAFLGAVPTLNS